MARRHRSGRSLRELRDEVAAADALGLNQPKPKARSTEPRAHAASPGKAPASHARRAVPTATRQRLVWAVCDTGGRTVASFPYSQKADAEAQAAALKAKGKGPHFVRSVKESMTPED
jgi:hypothetical protein